MTERTVTLSDGSRWDYYAENQRDQRWLLRATGKDGTRYEAVIALARVPHLIDPQHDLTAADHRAIADVLDPREANPLARVPSAAPSAAPREGAEVRRELIEVAVARCNRIATMLHSEPIPNKWVPEALELRQLADGLTAALRSPGTGAGGERRGFDADIAYLVAMAERCEAVENTSGDAVTLRRIADRLSRAVRPPEATTQSWLCDDCMKHPARKSLCDACLKALGVPARETEERK